MKPKAYIIGSICDLTDNNEYQKTFDMFAVRQRLLEATGYNVINPMNIVKPTMTPGEAIKKRLRGLSSCDVCSPLTNWLDSDVSLMEKDFAETFKMPIIIPSSMNNDKIYETKMAIKEVSNF